MNLNYIDIHSHIQGKEYDSDRAELLSRMKERGIGTIVVGVDKKTSVDAIALAEQHENLWACIGVHPNDNLTEEFDSAWFRENAQHTKVVAIGECGLDYFRREKTNEEIRRQEDRFRAQIEIAIEMQLPLMLHIRDAHEDALRVLGEYKERHGDSLFGNVHFFTASSTVARQYIHLGFSVSVPGVVTFADEVAEAIRDIPLDWIHAETDSPFAAPAPHRGKRNEPTLVTEVVQKIAEIKKIGEAEAANTIRKNNKRLFGV